jgi:hypothetical protein
MPKTHDTDTWCPNILLSGVSGAHDQLSGPPPLIAVEGSGRKPRISGAQNLRSGTANRPYHAGLTHDALGLQEELVADRLRF